MSGGEQLRFWITQARSGTVVGEVEAVGSGSFTSQFGGGTCRLNLNLQHMKQDGLNIDWAAVERIYDWTRGGLHALAVTNGRGECVGEWLLMSRGHATDSGLLPVAGMEWAGYPALRSLNANHIYQGVPQSTIARNLLEQAFLSFNAGMQITIPAWTSSVTRTMDYRSHSAYYSDLLDEISAPDDGFEWHVDVAPVWDGDRLASVTRSVVFGAPVLSRASDLVIDAGEPGTRHGTGIIGGGDDFARYAQSVYGIGAGEGEKQVWEGVSDPTLTNAGYVNSTKNVSFPGVTDRPTLAKLAQAELTAAQNLADPFEAEARIEDLPSLPRVGTQIRLRNPRSFAFPDGLDESLRIGRVTISTSGPFAETVHVLAA